MVRPDKLSPLLYALVAAGLLTVDGAAIVLPLEEKAGFKIERLSP